MKSDTFYMSMLCDFYGELLTENQRELFDLYYNEDLSLTEIAEHAGITRQGVRDAVVRAESALRDIEDKLGLVKKYAGVEHDVRQMIDAATFIASINAEGARNSEVARWADTIRQIGLKLVK